MTTTGAALQFQLKMGLTLALLSSRKATNVCDYFTCHTWFWS